MTALGGWGSKRTGRVIVGLVGLLASVGYTLEAMTMPWGTQNAPGPGMFPVGVGVVAAIISVVVVLEALLTPVVTGPVDLPDGGRARMVLGFAVATIMLVAALPYVGQYVGAVLYCIALLKLIGPHRWPRTIAYGLALGLVISWAFIELLEVRMPTGLLWAGFR